MSEDVYNIGDVYNIKDMSFDVKFTIDEEGLRGLAAFLKEQEDETLDAIFSGKQGLILHDPKRGTAELRHVVRCKDCKYGKKNGKSPMYGLWCERFKSGENSLSVLPTDYCSYGERREQENE